MKTVVAAAGDALAAWADLRTVVLVEGTSDQIAIEALANRRGRHLATEGVAVVAMGGATNIGHFLDLLERRHPEVAVAGLCDAAEVPYVRRGLERAERPPLPGPDRDGAGLASSGFYVCVDDLEDELIRALGTDRVEPLLHAEGELRSFRIFQQQPAQQGRTAERQLHRFMGTRSGRKAQFARVLVDALDLARVPQPLDRLLAHV